MHLILCAAIIARTGRSESILSPRPDIEGNKKLFAARRRRSSKFQCLAKTVGNAAIAAKTGIFYRCYVTW